MPRIVLKGVTESAAWLRRYQRGLERLRGQTAYVYSRLPYAWGIEHGRHRKSGKLARRAGGSFYLRRAVATVQASARADISEGLARVQAPGPWILRRLARWVRRLARQNAPRRRGRLRRSIQIELRER